MTINIVILCGPSGLNKSFRLPAFRRSAAGCCGTHAASFAVAVCILSVSAGRRQPECRQLEGFRPFRPPYPAARRGCSFAIRSASRDRSACHKSQSCCKPSQKSALIPVTCASRRAVSGVTPRFPRTTSFSLGNETPSRIAKLDWEIPSGFRNSSRSISPGCVGGNSRGSRRPTRWRGFFAFLMVVNDFDLVGITVLPAEAYSVLIVYPDAVLSASPGRRNAGSWKDSLRFIRLSPPLAGV